MEQPTTILKITNGCGENIGFWIEPYGMDYTMGVDTVFTVVLQGNPEDNQFQIVVKKSSISIYGWRDTMSIFTEDGTKLDF